MAIDFSGNLHYLFRVFGSKVIEYAGPQLASDAEQVELSQKVTIPGWDERPYPGVSFPGAW